MTTLDIAIATHKPEGIERLAAGHLPQIEGVTYVVSWQNHQDYPLPAALERPDVEVYRFDRTGQSLNRNNAFDHCRADIIMPSDDDLIFYESGIKDLIEFYALHPEADFVTFKSIHARGIRYPEGSCKLSKPLPKNYNVACIELSFRRRTGLRCCPELGLGSPRIHGGEDEILLETALRRGLDCRFVPITVCEHDHPSTGTKSRFTNENIRAAGCIIALIYGSEALLRVPLKAWRIFRAGKASLPRALGYAIQGALEARDLRRRNRPYLW